MNGHRYIVEVIALFTSGEEEKQAICRNPGQITSATGRDIICPADDGFSEIRAVGLASSPGEIYFCDFADEIMDVGCNWRNPVSSLLLVWRKPADNGASDKEDIAIIKYELEIAENEKFDTNVQKFNISEIQCGYLCEIQERLYATSSTVARVLIPGLTKGVGYYARVRVQTVFGLGNWTNKLTMSIAISEPSPPRMIFVGSGG